MSAKRQWTRRELLEAAAMTALGCAIAACAGPAPTATPQPGPTQAATAEPTKVPVPTATPQSTKKPVSLVFGDLPRNETFIAGGTPANEVWEAFNNQVSALANPYNGYEQCAIEYPFIYSAGRVYPFLAQGWEYNQEGTEMALTITEGATWNDGEPVTMEDWTFTLDYRHANKDKGLSTLLDDAAYRVEGDNKIVFSFFDADTKEPRTNFRFHRTFFSWWRPLPKHIWEGQDPTTFANNPPVEAGPYMLRRTNADTRTVIWERRDDYWRQDVLPAPKYVVFTRQPEAELLVRELVAGNFDIAQLAYLQVEEVMAQNKFIKTCSYPDTCPRHMFMNCEHPPLNDPLFRRAMSLLVDREKAAGIDIPPSKPMFVPWPYAGEPDTAFYDPADVEVNDYAQYDPAKAASILDGAGYKWVGGKRVDKDGKPISLTSLTISVHTRACEAFPQMLAEEAAKLGIEVNPKTLEVGAYFEALQKGDFDLAYHWLCADPADPLGAYGDLHSRNYKPLGEMASVSAAVTRYKNPRLDELVDQIAQGDPADPSLKAAYKELFRIIATDQPYTTLFGIPFTLPINTEFWTWTGLEPPQFEPWYWTAHFRALLQFLEPVQ